MPDDHKRVYMLLELQKIKEGNIPHLYAFPTNLLEFSCIVFKGSAYVVFKVVKSNIEDHWSLVMNYIMDEPKLDKIEGMKFNDAYSMLVEISNLIRTSTGIKFLKRAEDTFPFVFKGPSNRSKNLSSLLSFLNDRCIKNG